MDVEKRDARRRAPGGARTRGLRARDALALVVLAAWVALILGNYAAPAPAPPIVPYAVTAAHPGSGMR